MSKSPPRDAGHNGWKDVIAEAPSDATILLVDDEQPVLDGLSKILTRLGYAVKTATSLVDPSHSYCVSVSRSA